MSALFTADDFSRATGGVLTTPFHATGVSIDSRTVAAGDLFIALRTASGDGHAHVADALRRGAAGAMVTQTEGLPDDAPLLLLRDTQIGLTELGDFARRRFEGDVIGVTGSVGKTTTKEMLRTMLSACGATHAAHASYNNHWGVPLTLARMAPDAAYAVIEIGMNNPGEIAPLAKLAAPDVAVITAVASSHIGHLGSLEAIADEKASIMQGVLQGGAAVLPADNALFSRLLGHVPAGMRVRRFAAADLVACAGDASGSDVEALIDGARVAFRLNVPGRHMVMNALAALNACAAIGADLARCAAALADFGAVSGRGVRRAILGGTATLLDESYNASAASIRAALAVLKMLPAQRRLAVLGDMRELGDHSAAEHAGLADAVHDSADLLYACGPWMKVLYDAVPANIRGAHAPDSAALAAILVPHLRAGDAVLVKGSLGSRMRVVVDALEQVAA